MLLLSRSDIAVGKCYRLREGRGIRRVVKVRDGEVTFVLYRETQNAGVIASLSTPLLFSVFVEEIETEVLCPC